MGKFPIITDIFSGGLAGGLKLGVPNSFANARHLDFRKDAQALTVLPAATKESGSTVTGLVTDMIQLPSGNMVAIDNAGGVYTRSIAGSWAKNATVLPSTSYGMVYNLQHDTIYIPGNTTVHSITNADGRYGGTFTVNAHTFTSSQDQASGTGHANTYTTTGSISEGATNLFSMTPAIEPLHSVKIWVTAKGSGDLTVTMHDPTNAVLGSSTILNANITNGAYNEFVFSTPPRMYVQPNAATYHFHITNPNGTASTIGTKTSSDFSTVDFSSWSNRLVQPQNGFHPVLEFLQYICICNERYLAVWEPISQVAPLPAEFQQHRLTFPSGYQGTGLALYEEYIVVACEQRSSSATNEFQNGKLFLWDGTSTTYNTIVDVPDGAPYGLFSQKNVVYYFAGGTWWAWSGASPVAIFQMPGTDTEYTDASTYFVNYPHSMAVRNKILLGAFPSDSNSTSTEHAVYSFGQRDKNYPNSFGYSYSISTLTRIYDGVNPLNIGMIKNLGDKLFISWRDDSQGANTYGVDKVDPNSNPYSAFTWESLINDFQFISIKKRFSRPDKDKEATSLTLTFTPLPSGCTITPKYKINRDVSWEMGTAAVAGDTEITLNINKRYREIQIGFDGTATTVTPLITSIVLLAEMLPSEED